MNDKALSTLISTLEEHNINYPMKPDWFKYGYNKEERSVNIDELLNILYIIRGDNK
jgi:hypothetical protein